MKERKEEPAHFAERVCPRHVCGYYTVKMPTPSTHCLHQYALRQPQAGEGTPEGPEIFCSRLMLPIDAAFSTHAAACRSIVQFRTREREQPRHAVHTATPRAAQYAAITRGCCRRRRCLSRFYQ